MHPAPTVPPSGLLRLLFTSATVLALAGCGGDAGKSEVSVDDIDQSTSITVTEEELARFRPAADSSLTEAQVTAYLRTSLLQFDLIREESKRLQETVSRIEQREAKGGVLRGFQNMVDAGRGLVGAADMIGGSYVRAARALGYNPAEMEWVQERMAEVSSELMLAPLRQQAAEAAAEIRAQAEGLRAAQAAGSALIPGAAEQIGYLLQTADEIESQHEEQVSRSASKNAAFLKRIKPAVTADMWTAIGFAGGASGLMALSGWGDPADAETERKLTEFREIYQAALDNRAVTSTPEQ